jgi:hypothetical protein
MTRATATPPKQATDKTAIRPFQVDTPEAELTELRRRIKAAKLPEPDPHYRIQALVSTPGVPHQGGLR